VRQAYQEVVGISRGGRHIDSRAGLPQRIDDRAGVLTAGRCFNSGQDGRMDGVADVSTAGRHFVWERAL